MQRRRATGLITSARRSGVDGRIYRLPASTKRCARQSAPRECDGTVGVDQGRDTWYSVYHEAVADEGAIPAVQRNRCSKPLLGAIGGMASAAAVCGR